MTKQERQGIADAFRACLPYLWDGVYGSKGDRRIYICEALMAAGAKHANKAKGIIGARIRGHRSFESWLWRQIGNKRYQAEVTTRRMQAHRKAWVLQLIEEFER